MTWPLVIGLGSHHGDDQAGWLVVSHLRERKYPEARLASLQHPAQLLDIIEADQDLVICDACSGNGDPGAIHSGRWKPGTLFQLRTTVTETSLPGLGNDVATERPRHGSHDLSLFEVMELAYSLNSFPVSAEIWTMEGSRWVPGTEASAAIKSAAVRMADLIWEKNSHA